MKDATAILASQYGSEKDIHGLLKWYNGLLAEFKTKEIGYGAIAIYVQSCLGSIAVMLLMMHHMPGAVKFIFAFLITIICMCFNGAVLSQQQSKIVLNLLILSIGLSSAVIIANLF
jgi:hypothetical protein